MAVDLLGGMRHKEPSEMEKLAAALDRRIAAYIAGNGWDTASLMALREVREAVREVAGSQVTMTKPKP
jgi:hypothetical protein